MTTRKTIPTDRIRFEVEPGDLITEVDGRHLRHPHRVHDDPFRAGNAVRLVNRLGTETVWNLYPDTQVRSDITVERDSDETVAIALLIAGDRPDEMVVAQELTGAERVARTVDYLAAPEAEPVKPAWDARERNALRRNPHYADTLRLLDPAGKPTDLRTRFGKPDGRGRDAAMHSHTCGTLSAFYGWTEKAGTYTWRLTPRGASVLAAYERGA